jgi:hypothetical protein
MNNKGGCPNLVATVGGVPLRERKSRPSLVGVGSDGARGCRSPPWRDRCVCRDFPTPVTAWLRSPGEKPRLRVNRPDGGVLDIVTLLRASCLETWR